METTETQTEQKPAETTPEKTLTQTEVNAILARERSKLERTFNERIAALEPKAKLAEELEQKAREAEEAKMSATQRQERDLKVEREKYESRIKELDALSRTEVQRRHGLMVQHAAASRLGALASKLFNPEIAQELEGIAASAMRVEEVDGREVVTIRLGAEGDTEPLDTGWAKFVDAKLTKFFKANGGAGAAHGGGNAGGRTAFAGLSPTDKIAASLKPR